MLIGGGLRIGLATMLASLTLVACTGAEGQPRGLTEATNETPTSAASTTQTPPTAPTSSDSSTQTVPDVTTLEQALLLVPADADAVVFTDVAAVKHRLGYGDMTGQSPTFQRFEFWEHARMDGAMLTGTRLYEYASVMSLDFGWTAEDVDWEVAWSPDPSTCTDPTECAEAGYVLGLRDDLDWNLVLMSLAANGFVESPETPELYTTENPALPFTQVRLLPESHALAVGEVVLSDGGADDRPGSIVEEFGSMIDELGTPESAYLRPGCVSLRSALGPDAVDEDVAAYFKHNDPSKLQSPKRVAVGINDDSSATVLLQYDDDATATADAGSREAIVNHWPSLQTSAPFSTVGVAQMETDADLGRVEIAIDNVALLATMVMTDDAPWALCPATPPQ
jgi:hypothetical protein